MTEHTPGLWMVATRGANLRIWATDRKKCVAQVVGLDSAAETRADARLIAAAPELLEALEEVVRRLGKLDRRLVGKRPHPNDISWAKEISVTIQSATLEAIAKARGTK